MNAWVGYTADAAVYSYVAKNKLGCTVVQKDLNEQVSWQGFASGEVDLIMENWGHADLTKQYITDQKVAVDAGPTGNEGHIGWYVPPWMAKSTRTSPTAKPQQIRVDVHHVGVRRTRPIPIFRPAARPMDSWLWVMTSLCVRHGKVAQADSWAIFSDPDVGRLALFDNSITQVGIGALSGGWTSTIRRGHVMLASFSYVLETSGGGRVARLRADPAALGVRPGAPGRAGLRPRGGAARARRRTTTWWRRDRDPTRRSWTTTRTPATTRSPAPTPSAGSGGHRVDADRVGRMDDVEPRELTIATVPARLPSWATCTRASTTSRSRWSRCWNGRSGDSHVILTKYAPD